MLTSLFTFLGSTAFRWLLGEVLTALRKRVNEQDWEAARREIMNWTRGGGRVLPGLVARRRAEAVLL